MAKLKDLTGQNFGKLKVIERVGTKNGHASWLCSCDCGTIVTVAGCHLKSGHTKSCGCLKNELFVSHGQSGTRLYNIWHSMISRCTDKNAKDYPRYGGRGITVCDEWQQIEPFIEWAMENGYQDDLSIDRKDNDGPYSPENCKWSTDAEQANNRRSNRMISYNGNTHTVAQWAELTGIKSDTICHRLNRGWEIERALTEK